MTINDDIYGECELEINHGRISCVDSFIETAYSTTLDRELVDEELEELQERFEAEIQDYSYNGGYTPNHN